MYTNITHEFRTPLSVIQGVADQLEGNEEAKETIQRNSIDLLNLVNQMLDLSELESGTLPLKLVQGEIINYLSLYIHITTINTQSVPIRMKPSRFFTSVSTMRKPNLIFLDFTHTYYSPTPTVLPCFDRTYSPLYRIPLPL